MQQLYYEVHLQWECTYGSTNCLDKIIFIKLIRILINCCRLLGLVFIDKYNVKFNLTRHKGINQQSIQLIIFFNNVPIYIQLIRLHFALKVLFRRFFYVKVLIKFILQLTPLRSRS